MKLNKTWIKKHKPCFEAEVWINSKDTTDAVKLLNLAIKEGIYDWANWTLDKILNKDNKTLWAINSAKSVLHIFEDKYPNDKRPRLAIEAAKAMIGKKRKTKKLKEAADAAYLAYADTYADAAYTAYLAYAAADTSAYARPNMRKSCALFGLNLLKKQLKKC